jgi:hypothetical protein
MKKSRIKNQSAKQNIDKIELEIKRLYSIVKVIQEERKRVKNLKFWHVSKAYIDCCFRKAKNELEQAIVEYIAESEDMKKGGR